MTWANGLQFDAGGNLLVAGYAAIPGARFDGVTDDSAAIQALFNSFGGTTRGQIVFPPGATAKISTGLTFKAGSASIDFNGLTLDASSMTSGYAFSIVQDSTNIAPLGYGCYQAVLPVSNLLIKGPGSNTNNLDGLFIGVLSGPGQISGLSLSNIFIWGFRDNFYIGNQVYIDQIYNCNLINAWRYGLNYQALVNAGENFYWHGGRIANCQNAGTAIGVYMASGAQSDNELTLVGTSIDYNDVGWSVQTGILNLIGCHQESNSSHEFGILNWSGSTPPASIYIEGGAVVPTEVSPRANLFTIGSDSRNNFKARCRFAVFGSTSTIINSTGGNVSLEGSVVDFSGPTASASPSIGAVLNRLYNPGFELGALTGWTATGATWTADNTTPHTGTWAAKMVAAGVNGVIAQSIPVRPGQALYGRVWANVTAYTSGSIQLQVNFYADAASTQLLSSVHFTALSAATGGYVAILARTSAPAATQYAVIQVALVNANMTAFLDDFELHIM